MAIDKAEWQYDSAMKEYCEATGKQQAELTSADQDTIWEYAGNHIAFFLTWLIRRDLLGDFHHEDYYEKQYLNDFGTVMDGKILCVGFSWDDYLKVEPLIDAAYKKYKG